MYSVISYYVLLCRCVWESRVNYDPHKVALLDGLGLKDSSSAGFVNQWMVSGSALLTGHSFVNCVKLKGSLVYTALRASRGRPEASARCDAFNQIESVGHILQMCGRTHGDRMNRHNAVNKKLTKELTKRGYQTRVEPPITTPAGLRKPDLVAFKGGVCMAIDVTIIGDTFDLDLAHARKVEYYNTGIIRQWCSRESGVPEKDILFSACVLNWLGTPSPRSKKELQRERINKGISQILSVRTLDGGCKIISTFRRTTSRAV